MELPSRLTLLAQKKRKMKRSRLYFTIQQFSLMVCFFLLSVNGIYAQSYKAAFKDDMCHCIEQENLKRRLTENTYKTCFRETLTKYAAQIDAQIVEEDPNQKFYKGQLARKELVLALEYELIYSCNTYFEFLESLRVSKMLIAREHAKETDLEAYNQQVALTPNSISYFMRAQLQFKLGNLQEAAADINRSLDVNPYKANVKSTRNELLLLAWIYEEQNKFTDAIAIYDQLYSGDFDTKIAVLRALAHKKSGGTSASVPNVIKTNESTNDNKNSARRRSVTRTVKAKVTSEQVIEKKKDTSSLKKLFKIDNKKGN